VEAAWQSGRSTHILHIRARETIDNGNERRRALTHPQQSVPAKVPAQEPMTPPMWFCCCFCVCERWFGESERVGRRACDPPQIVSFARICSRIFATPTPLCDKEDCCVACGVPFSALINHFLFRPNRRACTATRGRVSQTTRTSTSSTRPHADNNQLNHCTKCPNDTTSTTPTRDDPTLTNAVGRPHSTAPRSRSNNPAR
jgi:hypothetical protein